MMDHAIVARAVDGDAEAFRAIVEHFEPCIYRFIYGLVRDPEVARDLTQDTFVNAFMGIGKTNDLQISPWLYRVARNNALSWFRRRKVVSWAPLNRSADGEEIEEELKDETSMADQVVARQTLHELLGSLNPESRSLLLLAAEGFSYAEIGRVMELSEAAVRQRIFRAREKLRALSERWEASDV